MPDPAAKQPSLPQAGSQGLVLTGNLSRTEFASLLRADQRKRWKRGERVLVETYLAEFPAAQHAEAAVLDLIHNEVLLREEHGEQPQLPEYLQRFPQYGAQLRRQFELHAMLGGDSLRESLGGVTAFSEVQVVWSEEEAPDVVPGYEVLGELGRGGMGVVYKAKQVQLNRIVALKMILSGSHAHKQDLARFRAEAEAVAQLQHPNIVQIYEIGECQGRPFFSLEFIDGGSLDDRLEGKPQKAEPSAQLVETVARAVHAAHQRNIIHRDLKPANILLASDSSIRETMTQPKVTDFGLAKRLDSDVVHTQSGSVVGTPCYMAPEQAMGRVREVGPPVDIYALGAILYEMLTGRPPFVAETAVETMTQVVNDEPVPPRRLQPKVPPDLETICLKCLHKDPARRYPTALELADDLHRFLAGDPILARPVSPWERGIKWVRRRPALAALLGVILLAFLCLLGSGVWYHLHLQAAHDETREQLVRLTVAGGTQRTNNDDLPGALPWFVRALELEQGLPEAVAMHRLRLGSVLRECPLLDRVWFHQEQVNHAAFSPRGDRVLTAGDDGAAHVRDSVSGADVVLKHADSVKHASFSADGRWVVTASIDGTARVWDPTGKPRTPELKHDGPVCWAEFDAEGGRVLTASADGTARMWDALNGRSLRVLTHGRPLTRAAFRPDGQAVLTVGGDNAARLWQLGPTETEPIFLRHNSQVVYAAFSPNGQRVVTTSVDRTARIWDGATGKPIGQPMRHLALVIHAVFSPDSQAVLTCCEDSLARLWEVDSGRPLALPMRHGSNVQYGAFSADGRFLATAGDDNTARMWDAATGIPLTPPLRHNGGLTSVAFSPDLEAWSLLTASEDGTARLWRLPDDSRRRRPIHHEHRLNSTAFSPDGRRVLTASNDATARVWDADSGQPVTPPLQHRDPVKYAAFSPDGLRVVTASSDGTAQVWDAESGAKVGHALTHKGPVPFATFSPNGQRVVTASADHTACVWDAQTGSLLATYRKHEKSVHHAVFSPDSERVLSAGADGKAHLWNAATGQPAGPTFTHADTVYRAVFSPNGQHVVTASADCTAQVWDVVSGKEVGQRLRHGSKVYDACFSPDGKMVVTASDDNTARLWDASTGKPLCSPLRHLGCVFRASFRFDGKCVLTACDDGTARVWGTRTGEPITPPLHHGASVLDAAFRPDGKCLVTGSVMRTARLWELLPDERSLEDLKLLAGLLAGGSIDDTGGFVPFDREQFQALWQRYEAMRAEGK